jgi:hypothetical protein
MATPKASADAVTTLVSVLWAQEMPATLLNTSSRNAQAAFSLQVHRSGFTNALGTDQALLVLERRAQR